MLEKILKKVNGVVKEDNEIREFTLIPSVGKDRNVSPINYVWEEHALGLETWCAGLLFGYAQKQIFKWRCRKDHETLNDYLVIALLINPEVRTFWNIKRELLDGNLLDCSTELRFSRLVLSWKPKSYEAYSYRIAIFKKIGHAKMDFREESDLLDSVTRNTPNNYHAWNHRIWCFENYMLVYETDALSRELRFSEDWIKTHVSEHTGFHYRQHVIDSLKGHKLKEIDEYSKLVLNCDSGCTAQHQILYLLIYELHKVLPDLHHHFPGHESIWYHRKYVVHTMHAHLCQIHSVDRDIPQFEFNGTAKLLDGVVRSCRNGVRCLKEEQMQSTNLYQRLVLNEREFLDGDFKDEDVRLSRNYRMWLRCIVGIIV